MTSLVGVSYTNKGTVLVSYENQRKVLSAGFEDTVRSTYVEEYVIHMVHFSENMYVFSFITAMYVE